MSCCECCLRLWGLWRHLAPSHNGRHTAHVLVVCPAQHAADTALPYTERTDLVRHAHSMQSVDHLMPEVQELTCTAGC